MIIRLVSQSVDGDGNDEESSPGVGIVFRNTCLKDQSIANPIGLKE